MLLADWDASRHHIGESLRAYRALNNRFGISWALFERAIIELDEGTPDTAEPYALELEVFEANDDLSTQVLVLLSLRVNAEQCGGRRDRGGWPGPRTHSERGREPISSSSAGRLARPDPAGTTDGDPAAERDWAEDEAIDLGEAIA